MESINNDPSYWWKIVLDEGENWEKRKAGIKILKKNNKDLFLELLFETENRNLLKEMLNNLDIEDQGEIITLATSPDLVWQARHWLIMKIKDERLKRKLILEEEDVLVKRACIATSKDIELLSMSFNGSLFRAAQAKNKYTPTDKLKELRKRKSQFVRANLVKNPKVQREMPELILDIMNDCYWNGQVMWSIKKFFKRILKEYKESLKNKESVKNL